MNVDTSYLSQAQQTKLRKRQEGEARNALWAALTPVQQLEQLDRVFGKGKGASKQRAKIAKRMKN